MSLGGCFLMEVNVSERLEPGRLVRWQHEGGWKVGNIVYDTGSGGWARFVAQALDGLYEVPANMVEPHQTRKERGEE